MEVRRLGHRQGSYGLDSNLELVSVELVSVELVSVELVSVELQMD